MMMPPSNWNGYYSSASRKPDLILAYQKEIERLELELQTVPERMGLHFPRSSLRQTAM